MGLCSKCGEAFGDDGRWPGDGADICLMCWEAYCGGGVLEVKENVMADLDVKKYLLEHRIVMDHAGLVKYTRAAMKRALDMAADHFEHKEKSIGGIGSAPHESRMRCADLAREIRKLKEEVK